VTTHTQATKCAAGVSRRGYVMNRGGYSLPTDPARSRYVKRCTEPHNNRLSGLSKPSRTRSVEAPLAARCAVRNVRLIEFTAADVYEELAPAVLGYLRSRGARDPEDSTGDVFVRVAEGLGVFRGDRAALRRWVFTIAHNRLVDEYRRDRPSREPLRDDPLQQAVEDAPPMDAELLSALATLTDEQREVVVLRFVADLPLKDVAKIIGKRLGAVKMLQARGLAALASELSDKNSA